MTIPVYAIGTEEVYLADMLADQKVTKLSQCTDALQAAVRGLKAVSDRLQVDVAAELQPAEKAALAALAQVCTVTCLKILRSKSASQKQPTLRPAVEATLEFARTNRLEVPQGVIDRMEKLHSELNMEATPQKKIRAA